MPSILKHFSIYIKLSFSFKPYYNWNAFNTKDQFDNYLLSEICFKPYYNWNAFNTHDFARVLNSWLFSSFFNPRNI